MYLHVLYKGLFSPLVIFAHLYTLEKVSRLIKFDPIVFKEI